MIIRIILVVIFLVLSAFFSGAEIVYSKVNKLKLERDIESGDKKSKRALDIANNYNRSLTTILVGNNLVNIAMSSVSTILALELTANIEISEGTLTTLTTVVVTFIVLIFGEILPKALFQNYSYSLSRAFAPIIKLFLIIFYPIVFVVQKVINKTIKVVNKTTSEDNENDDDTVDDELKNMTDELQENGSIDDDDAELIKSAIDIIDTTAVEIMIPRVDVIAFNIDDDFDSIVNSPDFFKYSRVPLYKDTIDNIVGIVNTTIVLKKVLNHQQVDLKDALYEPLYVHKTMQISEVLKQLKLTHKHLAIVLDEWGGFMGILTMEDILEELFGEIWDEIDTIDPEYEIIGENKYVVDGDMNIYDLFDLLDIDYHDFESDYTTVGGWCIENLERFPLPNDKFEFDNLEVTIISVDGRRVDKVEILVNNKLDEE